MQWSVIEKKNPRQDHGDTKSTEIHGEAKEILRVSSSHFFSASFAASCSNRISLLGAALNFLRLSVFRISFCLFFVVLAFFAVE